MKLIVGLWNPGQEYQNNRHNVGFLLLDYFINTHQLPELLFDKKFFGSVWQTKLFNEAVIFLKPMTFMNLSWKAVLAIKQFYKIENKDILVLYDEIDIPNWHIRYRTEWSSWGHNWIKDIIAKLWTQEFWRLRIWVWRPSTKQEVSNYVLGNFSKEEYNNILAKYDEIEKYVREFIIENN